MDPGGLGKVYRDGEIIVRQGDVGDCMYVIQSGRVEVLHEHEKDGRGVRLGTLGDGDSFGEIAILERVVRSATIRALGEVRALTVDKKTFLRKIHEDPSMAFRVMQGMARRIRELSAGLARAETGGLTGSAEPHRILVASDEPEVRMGIRDFLQSHRYEVVEASNCQAAAEALRAVCPHAAILDSALLNGNAREVLPRLRAIDSGVPLVILTANGSRDPALRAIKKGTGHFLRKPVELPSLLAILQRLLEAEPHCRRQPADRRTREAREEVDPFLGTSPAIRKLAEQARKVLGAESPILIRGETGTGKGVLGRWLHSNGPRAEEPFVELNCAGLSRELLDSELFGHEKGAFTGAVGRKTGLLEVAHRGTVFLDEIGDMDLHVQPKLLKVLEEQRFRRVGDVRERQVDIKLIAATHQDLSSLVHQKRFREDLYFRINTISLVVPPLRERVEDILILARQLLDRCAVTLERPDVRLSPDAEKALRDYPWPGNIRELRNVLECAVLLSDRNVLTRHDLCFDPPAAGPSAFSGSTDLPLLEVERRHIARVLEEERGRVQAAAKRLGVPLSSLYQKINRYGIDLSKVRDLPPTLGRPFP